MDELTPERLRELAQEVEDLKHQSVPKQEFDELRRLVLRLAERVEQIAPANEIPEEHLAIISAVFAASLGDRFRIKHVRALPERNGWTQAGRVDLHAQRHVRRA
jgi:hypothetical protein